MSRFLTGMLVTGLSVWLATPGLAGERTPGPHRGRIVEAAGARLEFVLDTARRAHVYVLDASGVPKAPGKISVSLRAKLKSKAKLLPVSTTTTGFNGAKEDVQHFISRAPLPAPDGYEIILTVKSGKITRNVRIPLMEHICGGCRLAEYACICGH